MMPKWIRARLDAMPLFWKIYGFAVALMVGIVGLAEFTLEPLAEKLLEDLSDGFRPWHEFAIWAVVILVHSLLSGYILSKILSDKLGTMAKASKALARGNLEARLPENGNPRDAFDILANSFNEMAVAIKAQRRYERRRFAVIPHELRAPLTRMAVATDLLNLKHGYDEGCAALLMRLGKEIRHMNEVISLLMKQARDKLLDSGIKSALLLDDILTELVNDFSFQGEMRHVRIKASVAAGLMVYGNALMLGRMFGNILSNAIFFSPPDSVIELDAKQEGDAVSIAVRDFGPGVPEDQLEAIFRPFYRVGNSPASNGIGLGLPLAREAAILFGGNIVASNARPGLRVLVTLPVCDTEQDAPRVCPVHERPGPNAHASDQQN